VILGIRKPYINSFVATIAAASYLPGGENCIKVKEVLVFPTGGGGEEPEF